MNFSKEELENHIRQLKDRITTLESELEEAHAEMERYESESYERAEAAEALAVLAPNPDNTYDQLKAEYFRDHFAQITLEELEEIVRSKEDG